MQIIIRKASIEDKEFLCKLIDEGIRDRHFINAKQNNTSELVNAAIKKEIVMVRKGFSVIKDYKMCAKIAEYENQPVAILITSKEEGNNSKLEFLMLSVIKEFRHKGIGTKIIKEEIENCTEKRFIVRCYRRSTYAMEMVREIGFKEINTTEYGTVTYEYLK